MKPEEVEQLFTGAGFQINRLQQIENRYWPVSYVEQRAADPWWNVITDYGMITIGWRKRVISINWEETPIRGEVTSDNVTKTEDLVHAYSMADALTYLTELRKLAQNTVPPEAKEPIPTKLVIYAHSRDCNTVTAHSDEGDSIELTNYTSGYVPLGMCIGGGDDIQLEIDIATGKILDWDTAKVRARIAEMTKKDEEDDS